MGKRSLIVLGSGVSGLSCGILLLREGYDVTIWAKDFPPNTTSNKAAAVWYPFVVKPPDKATRWARDSITFFHKEILGKAESGTKRMKVIEVFEHAVTDPWWKDGVASFRRVTRDECPEGYIDGYAIDGWVMDTDTYMDYLIAWYKQLGGKMIQKDVKDIKEVFSASSLVVNCTGLGSRDLFHDETIYPCRGQIVKVKLNEYDHSLFEEEGRNSLAYIIPRLHDIVLGGTVQDNNWSLEPDPKDTADILRKCTAIAPIFSSAEPLEIKVGLRPARPTLRLETEKYDDRRFVIHNYGHGGSGLTIGWGCAQDVVELVRAASK